MRKRKVEIGVARITKSKLWQYLQVEYRVQNISCLTAQSYRNMLLHLTVVDLVYTVTIYIPPEQERVCFKNFNYIHTK